MDSTLEAEVIEYIVGCKRAFRATIFEHFGRFREAEIKAALKSAISSGKLTETWIDDRSSGGIRYSIISGPESTS